MIRLILLAFIVLGLPSGIVLAGYLAKYLSIRLQMLEDKRQKQLLEDIEKQLK